jgi:hypothetical protein
MPAVCSAIGSPKFCELAGVQLLNVKGPANGANVYFQFALNPQINSRAYSPSESSTASKPKHETASDTVQELDLRDALVLVSCVRSKLPIPAPAKSLYTSAWFTKTKSLIEASGADWLVLSSRYGLLEPNTEIEPYDDTLNTAGVAERRAWAEKVLDQLIPRLQGYGRVVMLAGARYREFLIGPLQQRGIKVDIPMAHMRRGEQLGWLSELE